MKPSETKDESMQRADTQSPLRCSSPASSEAQPDHRRKVVQEVGSQRHSQWHPVSRQRENEPQCMQYPPKMNLGEKSSTWRKLIGEERVVPSRSNPDALQKKREGGAKEGNQTLLKHHGNLSVAKVRRMFV